nr:SpoIIE family protein phosphatase [Streptomyces caeruleatus]
MLGSFRVSAHEWQSLSRLAERLELSIARNSPAGDDGDPELFVTALVLEFPPDGGEVRIVDRGHPAPLVVGPQGARRLVTAPGLPLGLGGLAAGGDGADTTAHPLRPSEVLVLHTDGVSEARDADGVFYPVQERLGERCARRRSPTTTVPSSPSPSFRSRLSSKEIERASFLKIKYNFASSWCSSVVDYVSLVGITRRLRPLP